MDTQTHVQVKFDHFKSILQFHFFLQMKRQRPRWLAQVRSRPALFTPKGEPVGANHLPLHRPLFLLCLFRAKDAQMAHLTRLKYLGIGSDRWVLLALSNFIEFHPPTFSFQNNKSRPKKLVKSNKSISRKNFWPKSIFRHFKNGQKSIFELRKSLKRLNIQFHKKIDLFNFTSFFCLDFFKFSGPLWKIRPVF